MINLAECVTVHVVGVDGRPWRRSGGPRGEKVLSVMQFLSTAAQDRDLRNKPEA
jgi:hypothetical protein